VFRNSLKYYKNEAIVYFSMPSFLYRVAKKSLDIMGNTLNTDVCAILYITYKNPFVGDTVYVHIFFFW
jgi:hypothetical protein